MNNFFGFKITAEDSGSRARCGEFTTPHGVVKTPVFMPVGTKATVKTLMPQEVKDLGADIILANTYHLYLQPGAEQVAKSGGLHDFMQWDGPMLTDSGGFQVFSLGLGKEQGQNGGGKKLTKIKEDGVEFRSIIDGSKHFFSPRSVMATQAALGADVIMAFDECAPADCSKSYAREAMKRTHRWVEECKLAQQEMVYAAGEGLRVEEIAKARKELFENSGQELGGLVNKDLWGRKSNEVQALFPIVQGAIFDDLREESAKFMADLDLPGVAIGGLSVGETEDEMYHTLEVVEPHLPKNKPRYMMGVGTPRNLVECVARGVDMFDCVLATRLARHGTFWAHDENGAYKRFHIKNSQFRTDMRPLDGEFTYGPIKGFSRSYVRHLFAANELLGLRILSLNNLHVLIDLMSRIRAAIADGSFESLKKQYGVSA